ncbi:ORF6N domain-containing protein [Paenibacillus macquariensis]|uniref:ORF6N domain-containing protein n=1 Tax=Paenibacillus macquariensis TaxID=948756 RepID=A0ABY1JWZ6_9BACL|nr:ORF6N domain-containing protein [Paenibacillus macquariensis]MEC0089379.1 ORF6N domain-containing protein [Paenibacillus macquariensis]OAB33230.1 antirepressor [Paenibacillus macquariensis subsp. macquariensis]SIQ92565.1 ORF6N domain-containing protein [Paenibacillus macquariensis]
MNQLQIIDHNGQRVLTTNQLAESYEADRQQISYNFINNAKRYDQGKHFYSLTGDAKREFLDRHEIQDGSRNAAVLYLWTEKGAWLHAKSLNTDKAWEAYEMLIDDYYSIKETPSIDLTGLSPQLQLLINMEQGLKQIEQRQQEQEQTLITIKETFLQRDENWRSKINGLLNGTARSSGQAYKDIRSESYRILEDRGRCDLKRRLVNLKDRLEEQGATKTKLNETNRLDVIESEPRLKEIYTTIVKELSIGTLA